MIDTYQYVTKKFHAWKDIKMFYSAIEEASKVSLKATLEKQLIVIRDDYISASSYQRNKDRYDYRNGFYTRKLVVTPLGTLEQVSVPRCRHRGLREVIEGYITRGLQMLTPHMLDAFLDGIPIGKLGQIIPKLRELVFPFHRRRRVI